MDISGLSQSFEDDDISNSSSESEGQHTAVTPHSNTTMPHQNIISDQSNTDVNGIMNPTVSKPAQNTSLLNRSATTTSTSSIGLEGKQRLFNEPIINLPESPNYNKIVQQQNGSHRNDDDNVSGSTPNSSASSLPKEEKQRQQPFLLTLTNQFQKLKLDYTTLLEEHNNNLNYLEELNKKQLQQQEEIQNLRSTVELYQKQQEVYLNKIQGLVKKNLKLKTNETPQPQMNTRKSIRFSLGFTNFFAQEDELINPPPGHRRSHSDESNMHSVVSSVIDTSNRDLRPNRLSATRRSSSKSKMSNDSSLKSKMSNDPSSKSKISNEQRQSFHDISEKYFFSSPGGRQNIVSSVPEETKSGKNYKKKSNKSDKKQKKKNGFDTKS